MRTRAFLNCLPLLASSLGQRYGVTVEIGGDEAYTNGSRIRLPSLPHEADARFIGLVRGYIDHEAAHIRFTDFEVLTASPSPLLHTVWNILEDWRIELRMGQLFPGARQNFEWLIRHLFLGKRRRWQKPGFGVLDWLLFTVRSWSVPDLARKCQSLERKIEVETPGLLARLLPILDELRLSCPDTAACFAYARRILEELRQQHKVQKSDPSAAVDLTPLLLAGQQDLPTQIGELLAEAITVGEGTASVRLTSCAVARWGDKPLRELGVEARAACLSATAAMRVRLQGLLQANRLQRVARATKGRLDPRRLYGAAVGDGKLFRRSAPVRALDTHVHILLDCSGSMRERIGMTCQTAYAVAKALDHLRIPVAVTAFPGLPDEGPTIVPILRPGEPIHDRFEIEAVGGTPLAEALWAVLIQLQARRDDRQIILILTDGSPDDMETSKAVLRHAQALGVEVYGLGLQSPAITDLLPGRSSSIDRIDALPVAFFGLLEQALISGASRT